MLQKVKQPDRSSELDIALDAARRATEEALHGPAHLRSGRYHPTPDTVHNEGVRGDDPEQAPGKPERG